MGWGGTWGPAELRSSKQVDMEVEHRLSCVFAIINNNSEALLQFQLFGDFRSSD